MTDFKDRGPAVLAIGSELLDGRVHESNSLFAARALGEYGITFSRVALCDDVEGEILDTLELLVKSSSLVIVSGGLGPTTDDLTREALAKFCGVGLYEDQQSLAEIQELFRKRKREFNPTNRKQAVFPEGAEIIKNPVGTAPGFSIATERNGRKVVLVALPGVPKEFNIMFTESVLPLVVKHLGAVSAPPKAVVRTFGLAESEIGGRVEALTLDPSLVISYRAHFPEIQTKIVHPSDNALVSSSIERIEQALGRDYVFARDFEGKFEDAVLSLLVTRGKTVSFAESCTGGAIGNMLSNPAGASAAFLGSAVTYSNQAKSELLGVPAELIERDGAVSASVAEAMARGARERFGSDMAVSVTGIAGPGGGSEAKPVGTFYVGFATADSCETFKLFFLSSRDFFKRYVACTALDIVRRHLSGFELSPYRAR